MDLMKQSPYGTFLEHIKKGELAYQVSEDGKAVFYPRAVAPGTGSDKLEWRVSKGLGTVYATTAVFTKDQPPHNVVLIDLDEGFRMMSRVEDIDPVQVKIGMRVKVRMHPGDEKQPPYPVFTPTLTPDPLHPSLPTSLPMGERRLEPPFSPREKGGDEGIERGASSSPSPLGGRGRDGGRGGAK